jgi:hypothetical protein
VLRGTLRTQGGEAIIKSSDKNFAYVSDGVYGVTILDLSSLPELKVASNVELEGWTNCVMSVYDEKFIIVVTM